ncbi:helix-turn-helix transcriptional regulator [Tateyamaria sp. Alg231-49]|uniref:helix-turn-helix transcriptional regulator n=1 Tax=Tateyamaria sp. Alg231-49 TaxID=1922219 RepID=UPI00131F0A72|nr:helix-turn-helix transcriptional regulator [Tateyamaria sp. Alg231-49]
MENTQETILKIYDAAADDALWPDVLQRIADGANAAGSLVLRHSGHGDDLHLSAPYVSNVDHRGIIDAYLGEFRNDEVRDQLILVDHTSVTDDINLLEDDVLAPDLETLKSLPSVRRLQEGGLLHRAACLLNKDNTGAFRFAIQLDETRGRLSPEEKAYLMTLLPHLAKAFDLGQPAYQVASNNLGLLGAIDHLNIGICVLDAVGRVATKNAEFDRQLDLHSVFSVAKDGKFQFSSPDHQKNLSDLQVSALKHGRFGARPRKEAIPTGNDGYLCIEFIPLDRSAEMGTTRFEGTILYSSDTSRPRHLQIEAIQLAHGLTATEAEIISAMADGFTNTQIAEQRERSVTTITSQVKSILAKTNCSTRTQLVRLMMSFGADFLNK